MTKAEMKAMKAKEEKKNKLIRAKISYFLEIEGYSKRELAELLGMSISTLYNKLNKPNGFTLGEFRMLILTLRLTDSELLAIV